MCSSTFPYNCVSTKASILKLKKILRLILQISCWEIKWDYRSISDETYQNKRRPETWISFSLKWTKKIRCKFLSSSFTSTVSFMIFQLRFTVDTFVFPFSFSAFQLLIISFSKGEMSVDLLKFGDFLKQYTKELGEQHIVSIIAKLAKKFYP